MNKEQNDIAIRVENLSKCYQIYDTPRDRLKQFILPRVQRVIGRQPKQYFREFWALKDISFEVKKGETIGIIGRNGSGKSTLLQMICGTLSPTSGSITTHGRIAALLELGSGFNPEFTGRENVYMNASVLGLSKEETDARFDDIAAFADIGDFIEQPIKTFSSGMMMRLAFAVAINVEPKILIIDEALSVGDIAFQSKCFKKIQQMRWQGTTILFVTHDISTLSTFCDRAVLIHKGRLKKAGEVNLIVNEYKKLISIDEKNNNSAQDSTVTRSILTVGERRMTYQISKNYHRSGDGSVTVLDWCVVSVASDAVTHILEFGREYFVVIDFVANKDNLNPNIGFFLSDAKGLEITGSAINHEEIFIPGLKKGDMRRVTFQFKVAIRPGNYFINIGISEANENSVIAYDRHYSITEITVVGKRAVVGFFSLQPKIEIRGISE